MIQFIKTHKTIVILLAILFSLIIIDKIFLQKESEEPVENKPLEQLTNFKNISPGTSTKAEVIEKLGTPLKEDQSGNLLQFKSSAPGKPHEILFEEDKVTLIKETVYISDQKTINDIKKNFGEPKDVLYGPRYIAGFNLYVYPEKGVAYIGQEESGVLLEVWYFPTNTLEIFNSKFASEYSKTPPSTQIPQGRY
ncbi:hypothetical protein A2715_03840 [Candidatus Woesebacteria bacterium RIFCSPHIGHO2_01_FULL_39_32]|uniref:Uncharacterized protein n=1 Tax=Candidatus Woesebacteria bacterium RIFCSPLOWO2_01_FULL_39_25 TaxID=1802521 RepID=A0A1F8BIS9_9BACT|nr:MAG: hypothetical protein A2124_01440 [Candidatus Woesebacteria bacterium GWB1_37_5]OGM25046.1 MAG: hypothetical protein A2715_03840 [Candidatus Woesebacteria bacterium RIFCSPHIGHO2_01_FULL_39_32]OGM36634.1 MAG: hypothetical protein A3F01_05760 [Candidatus Woesebacteria bacterium RIFCSPHIGHO2_12_FULL_38_11]OGM63961.1 MAG: hypothetical protein A2893_00430 [Candidatus Woesebacteria bacterium RIFCSPLOWO2_01_FULL_39_25]